MKADFNFINNISANTAKNSSSSTNKTENKNDSFKKLMDKNASNKAEENSNSSNGKQVENKKSTDKAEDISKDEKAEKELKDTKANEVLLEMIANAAISENATVVVMEEIAVPTEKIVTENTILPIQGDTNVKVLDASASKNPTASEIIQTGSKKIGEQLVSTEQESLNKEINKEIKSNSKGNNEISDSVKHESIKTVAKEEIETPKERPVLTEKPVEKAVIKKDSGTDVKLTEEIFDVNDGSLEDGKVVKFKVADVINVNTDNVAEKLAEKIIVKSTTPEGILLNKSDEFEIQLTPEDLGKITIKVSFEAGKALVDVICANSKAINILAENARGLTTIIEANTGAQATVVITEDKNATYDQQERNPEEQNRNAQEDGNSQKNKNDDKSALDFMQQLRLGLVGTESLYKGFY